MVARLMDLAHDLPFLSFFYIFSSISIASVELELLHHKKV